MDMKRSKFLSYAVIACGFFSSAFAADTQDSDDMVMNRSSSEETQFREITPNAGPRVTNGVDVFITADFIYWTARQDGLAYARSGLVDYTEAVALGNTEHGETYYPATKFSPGFKVGIGLNLGHDGWDTLVNYTWYRSNHHHSIVMSEPSALSPVPLWEVATLGSSQADKNFLVLSSFVNVGKASSSWSIHFNNIDWEMGRNFYISQYLTLRPYAGLKGTWMHQYFSSNLGNFEQSDISSEVSAAAMYQIQKFWGVGIRTGLDASWYMTKNWSIFSNTALSALWGRFYNSREDSVTLAVTETNRTIINTRSSFHTVKPVLEMQLGVRYDYWFCDDDYHFGIEAAWEEQVWFSQNQFIELLSPSGSSADLLLQGLTIDFRFDF